MVLISEPVKLATDAEPNTAVLAVVRMYGKISKAEPTISKVTPWLIGT